MNYYEAKLELMKRPEDAFQADRPRGGSPGHRRGSAGAFFRLSDSGAIPSPVPDARQAGILATAGFQSPIPAQACT